MPVDKHQRASKHSDDPPYMKDGYAKGPVPKAMRASKPGKTDKVGYTGPDVATGRHPGSGDH